MPQAFYIVGDIFAEMISGMEGLAGMKLCASNDPIMDGREILLKYCKIYQIPLQ